MTLRIIKDEDFEVSFEKLSENKIVTIENIFNPKVNQLEPFFKKLEQHSALKSLEILLDQECPCLTFISELGNFIKNSKLNIKLSMNFRIEGYGDSFLKFVSLNQSISELYLNIICNTKESYYKDILKNQFLKKLNIEHLMNENDVNDIFESLENSNLEVLWIDVKNYIKISITCSERVSKSLELSKSLKDLLFCNIQFSKEFLEYFSKGLKNNKSIMSLRFLYCDIVIEGCSFLSESIEKNQRLDLLKFHNSLTLDSLKILSKGVSNNNSISNLLFNFERELGDSEFLPFLFANNQNLKVLNIDNCILNDNDLEKVNQHPNLLKLVLPKIKYGEIFFETLIKNHTIEILDLKIIDRDSKKFRDYIYSLRDNSTLKSLKLSQGPHENFETFQLLFETLKLNNNIEKLHIKLNRYNIFHFKVLYDYLISTKTLLKLKLISSEQVTNHLLLFQGISQNKSLNYLNLSLFDTLLPQNIDEIIQFNENLTKIKFQFRDHEFPGSITKIIQRNISLKEISKYNKMKTMLKNRDIDVKFE